MFHDLIRELESDGHEIIITSRPLANTVQLLDQRGLKHTVIGEHYGKNIYKKIFGYPIRVMQLRKFLAPLKPDLAISQSSFHSPIVAKLLGIPSIYTNDNEHAMGNKPAFICASKILIPENLAIEKIAKSGVSAKKITQYPGVKEGIYLWSKGERIQQKRKEIEEDEFNNFNSIRHNNNHDNYHPQQYQQQVPHKYSPQYAAYVGVKSRAQASARIRLGGVY
jgi:predicted glycosyltransferase